jgi:hypothetical protein
VAAATGCGEDDDEQQRREYLAFVAAERHIAEFWSYRERLQ